jgi:hypothetical protein
MPNSLSHHQRRDIGTRLCTNTSLLGKEKADAGANVESCFCNELYEKFKFLIELKFVQSA